MKPAATQTRSRREPLASLCNKFRRAPARDAVTANIHEAIFLMRIAVITVSDSVANAERKDASGPAVVAVCRELGWEIISTQVLSDAQEFLSLELRALAHGLSVDVILTTGGTGLGPRDNAPEATLAIADRLVPGIGEEMRRARVAKVPTAALSRAVAVICGATLIVNLPGSPKG